MFNVKVDKYNIQFTFQHVRGVGEEVGIGDVTRCVLKVNGREFEAIAARSMKDTFVKEVGRKLSLKRALAEARKTIELPYEVRDMIWMRYQGRHVANAQWVFGGASGILDAEYSQPRTGSDDLTRMA